MSRAISFVDRYGGAKSIVDYEGTYQIAPKTLPTPLYSDTLEELAKKLRDIAVVVEQGGSAAVATGFKAATHQERDPEKIAARTMTAAEKAQYKDWKEGGILPVFDWATNVKSVPEGKESAEKYERRATAMSIIFVHDGVTPEHASWLTENMTYVLPLVMAITKVQHARQQVEAGFDTLIEMEMAEMQVAHDVHARASKHVNDIFRALRLLTKDIDHSKGVLQARERDIKARFEGYNKEPLNNKIGAKIPVGDTDDVEDTRTQGADLPSSIGGLQSKSRKRRRGQGHLASEGEDMETSAQEGESDGGVTLED